MSEVAVNPTPQADTSAPVRAEHYLVNQPAGRSELVAGEIIGMSPASLGHGRLTQRIAYRLSSYLEKHPIGEVFTGEVGYILSRDPDTVRAPDVSFVKRERIPPADHADRFFEGAPDLAVEVVSPSDRWMDVEQKVIDYLTAGGTEVWVADPKTRTVQVTRKGSARRLGLDDTLTSDLLPGFELPLAELFA